MSQCERLWDDIIDAGSTDDKKLPAHFIGSIVYVHDNIYDDANNSNSQYVIIDGQQRLTTITLIYLNLYYLFRELEEKGREIQILETYLINKFESEDSEKLKLRTTENNAKALQSLLRSKTHDEISEYSHLIENFDFFHQKITK